jgi:hypothetical protein
MDISERGTPQVGHVSLFAVVSAGALVVGCKAGGEVTARWWDVGVAGVS